MAVATKDLVAGVVAERESLRGRLDTAAYLLQSAAYHTAKGNVARAKALIDAAVLHAQYVADVLDRQAPQEVA